MGNKRKILNLCNYTWETGGPSSVILNHARFQLKQNFDVSVASSTKRNHHLYPIEPGMKLFIFPQSFFSRFLSEFSFPLIFWFYRNRNEFDLIHIHGLWYFGAVLPFIIPNQAKKIITIHGFLDSYTRKDSKWKKGLFWKLFQQRFIASCDIIHAINKDEERILKKLFPGKNVIYIPNALDEPEHHKAVPELSFQHTIESFIADSPWTFVFIGRISFKKGLDILLKSFHNLSNVYQNQVKLIIAGPDDDYSNELSSFLESYPFTNILKLATVRGEEKKYLLTQKFCFVLPSYSEGFSIAALEALAHKNPCILSNKVGFRDGILAYDAALLCQPNESSLTDSFLQYVQYPELKSKLSKNGYELFQQKYLLENVASDLIIEINTCFNRQSAKP
jgi:glycosyltransferase involved in cell wall biosynthesis